ncbi:molecular chaperone TorD family protein [Trichlorobacter lovleyi]|uniref:TorD/DmsD family molecular chaperone n=1 Tax=Trichlorobacter lovleyi TaxID=313985 RepID=UPI00224021BC|nr:molecular chaperone TorD family protein [Trichlorobacter lovleyi]QOX78308.1 molecular chaperone TorD family protein [Trichlorobacter lovleyi]
MPEQTATTGREDSYRLLAACYYSPNQALFEENCCTSLAGLLSDMAPDAAASAAEAAELLHKIRLDELLVEHARLFMGPFKLVAPPYGSVWLDQHKSVMGDSTAKVAAFYHANGLHLADDFHELPDHFAVELEFMSYLAFRQREAAAAGVPREADRLRDLQREFLGTFLLPWFEPFTDAIIDDAEAPFYQALARCTAAFIRADARSLNAAAHA